MASLASTLLTALRALSREAGRRHPAVRDATDAAVTQLAALEGQPSSAVAAHLASADGDVCVRPLCLACEAGNSRLAVMAISVMQTLLQHNAMSAAALPGVLATLAAVLDLSNDQVSVKVLQTVTTLTSSFARMHGAPLAQVMSICFRLTRTRTDTVANTAGATLRQNLMLAFDRYADEVGSATSPASRDVRTLPSDVEQAAAMMSKAHEPRQDTKRSKPFSSMAIKEVLSPAGCDAFLLIQDIALMTNGEASLWLSGAQLTPSFGLEVLEMTIHQHPHVFRTVPVFQQLIRDRVVPLVLRMYQYDKDFVTFTRMMRLVMLLLSSLSSVLLAECGVLLTLIFKAMDNHRPLWQRTLALEVVKAFASDFALMQSFYMLFDYQLSADQRRSDGAYFATMVTQLGRHLQNNFDASLALVVRTLPTSGKVLDGLSYHAAPTVDPGYALSLALESIIAVVDGIHALLLQVQSASGTDVSAPSASRTLCRSIAEGCWPSVLAGLSVVMDRCPDEEVLQAVLKCYQRLTRVRVQGFINCCGQLGLTHERDAFLTSMRKYALPRDDTDRSSSSNNNSRGPSTATLVMQASASQLQGLIDGVAGAAASTLAGATGSSGSGSGSGGAGGGGGGGGGGVGADEAAAINGGVDARRPLAELAGLSPKNVLVLKTMLNIGHCFGAVLDGAWLLLLQTFEQLDAVLQRHERREQGSSGGGGGGGSGSGSVGDGDGHSGAGGGASTAYGRGADLAILAGALQGLFESTRYLDDQAVLQVVENLRMLSAEALLTAEHATPAQLAAMHSRPQLFAVSRIVDVLMYNPTRLPMLWNAVHDHLVTVCNHSDAGIRAYGVAALSRIVDAGLLALAEAPRTEHTDAFQQLLFQPLVQVSSSSFSDSRELTLRALHDILQSNGGNLISAWPLVLQVLGDLAGQGMHLSEAFRLLRFVCTDYLDNVNDHPHGVAQCISVTGVFAGQRNDINISLTAVEQLVQVANFLATPADGETDADTVAATDASRQHLWLAVFEQIERLCGDPRSAIRTSALQTLFSTLNLHGAHLQQETWESCIWRILFPVLQEVAAQAAAAQSSDRNMEVELGQENGRPVTMMLHHTRNTAQKQWSETRAKALNGVARVFKTYFALLSLQPKFQQAWENLLDFLAQAVLSNTPEVSSSAIAAFQSILIEHAGRDYFSADAWAAAWAMWGAVADGATAQTGFDHAILTELVRTLCQVTVTLRRMFSVADVRALLNQLAVLALYPASADDVKAASRSRTGRGSSSAKATLLPLQAATMELLAAMAPYDEQVWPLIFVHLLAYISAAIRYPFQHSLALDSVRNCLQRYAEADVAQAAAAGAAASAPVVAALLPLAERALAVLEAQYQAAPAPIQLAVFPDVLAVLGAAMRSRYAGAAAGSLWRDAVRAYVIVVKHGLAALATHDDVPQATRTSIWGDLADTMHAFLVPSSQRRGHTFPGVSGSAAPAAADNSVDACPSSASVSADGRGTQDLEVDLVNLLTVDILPRSVGVPQTLQERLVDILDWCATDAVHLRAHRPGTSRSTPQDQDTEQARRHAFAQSCFRSLFLLCQQGGEDDSSGTCYLRVAQLAFPVLVQRCRDVLQQFIREERRSGRAPLPRDLLSEVVFLLQQIRTLELHPRVADPVGEDKPASGPILGPKQAPRGPRALLLRLMPVLVDCVVTRETQIQYQLRDLLHLAVREAHLDVPSALDA